MSPRVHPAWRATIVSNRLQQVSGDDSQHGETESETYALAMSLANCWDDLVDLLLNQAERAKSRGLHAGAAVLGSRALMELDRTRYSLAAQSARTSWSKRMARGLSVTLDAAYQGQDARLQAELIEFARVQTLPTANGEIVGDATLAVPPVVRVRGQTRLARPLGAARP